jgi:predicted TIM-barrel fold metal-dependent hydrolase
MTTGKIDVHHHIFPPGYIEAIGAARFASLSASGKVPPWSAEQSLELMEQQNIEVAMTSVSAPGIDLGDPAETRRLAQRCNDYAARLVSDRPGRFGAFASLPLPDVDAAIQEVDRCFDDLGADGVVLLSNYGGLYLGNPLFNKLFAHLNARKAVVFLHPTASGFPNCHPDVSASTLEFPFDTARAVASLLYERVFDQYPHIRFIISHAGGAAPYLAWRMNDLSKKNLRLQQAGPVDIWGMLRRQYFDTALSSHWPIFRLLGELTAPSNFLFGSDFQFVGAAQIGSAVQELSKFELTPSSLADLERANALALFPRLAGRLAGAAQPVIPIPPATATPAR